MPRVETYKGYEIGVTIDGRGRYRGYSMAPDGAASYTGLFDGPDARTNAIDRARKMVDAWGSYKPREKPAP